MDKVKDTPFKHLITKSLFGEMLLDDILDEFPQPDDPRLKRYSNDKENKLEGPATVWGEWTREYFRVVGALAPTLSDMFNIPDLHLETIGGGYHLIPPGGYLGVHTDFNRSPDTRRYRRLNFLTFLNHDWLEENRGELILRDRDGTDIITVWPEFGTTAIFETSDHSWHGHPHPTVDRWRYSIAAYFFTEEQPDGFSTEHSTVWL